VFKEILGELVGRVPNAVGAIFADDEGEAVEYWYDGPEYDIKLLGAHHGIILGLLEEAAENLGHGRVLMTIVGSRGANIIAKSLKDGYYLVLVLPGNCNLGLALYEIEQTADRLIDEM
jgi:predicted regulator of Ras-like GTPase activity (Roadblock/LC7/MglB family)